MFVLGKQTNLSMREESSPSDLSRPTLNFDFVRSPHKLSCGTDLYPVVCLPLRIRWLIHEPLERVVTNFQEKCPSLVVHLMDLDRRSLWDTDTTVLGQFLSYLHCTMDCRVVDETHVD